MNSDAVKTNEETFAGAPTSLSAVSTPPAAKAEGLPVAGYGHSATLWVGPRLLRWLVPTAAIALVVLLFFPWTGAFPSGYPAYTQNAFQTIWGGVSVNHVAMEALDAATPYDKVETDPLMLLYVMFVALTLVLVVAPLLLSSSSIQAFPAIVAAVWRRRMGLLGASVLAAFVVLMIQLWMGFGFEAAVAAKADKNQAAEIAAAKTPEEREKANIHRGLEVSPFNLGRTHWLHLAVFSNVVLLVSVGLELWLKRRGAQPLPRIDVHA